MLNTHTAGTDFLICSHDVPNADIGFNFLRLGTLESLISDQR